MGIKESSKHEQKPGIVTEQKKKKKKGGGGEGNVETLVGFAWLD